MKHSLEKNSIFPYVAWVVFISFAVFTGMLANRLNEIGNSLAERNHQSAYTLEEAQMQ